MSWKFGGVYIKPGFEDPEAALNFLHIDKRFSYSTLSFTEVVKSSFTETAIGNIDAVTLVHDNVLPYNNGYEEGIFTDADFYMMDMSRTAEILSFYLDGITASYGFNHFKDGALLRRYSVLSGQLIVGEGVDAAMADSSSEKFMLEYLSRFTGNTFQSLLQNQTLEMYLFTPTGF